MDKCLAIILEISSCQSFKKNSPEIPNSCGTSQSAGKYKIQRQADV